MKFCVFIIFQLCPWIVRVGDWALRWTEGNEQVQVFFVMLFFPVVMNAIQYYIIDSFIKNQKPPEHERIPSEDEDEDDYDERRRSHTIDHDFDGDSDGASDDEANKIGDTSKISGAEDKELPSNKATTHNKSPKKLDEYDPETDGEQTGGSSGQDNGSTSPKKANAEGKGV